MIIHHISEHFQRAAAKINKSKLAITLQDKDKPPFRLSESDEESITDPGIYPYNDGEVAMKKVMSPVPWDSTSGEEGEYLLPRGTSRKDEHYPPKYSTSEKPCYIYPFISSN